MKIAKWFFTVMSTIQWLLLAQTAIGCMFFGWKREGSDLFFVILMCVEVVFFTAAAVCLWQAKTDDPA